MEALELRHAEAGGARWVAARPLAKHEVLEPGEAPLLAWPAAAARGEPDAAAAASAAAFLRASVEVQRKVLELFREPPEEAAGALYGAWRRGALSAAAEAGELAQAPAAARAAAAAHLNAFELLDGRLALFERCSRFNHACAPGAEYSCTQDGRVKVRTLRRFDAGEEVHISYLGGDALLTRPARRDRLRQRYVFECGCCLCGRPVDELAALRCPSCGSRAAGPSCGACGSERSQSTDREAEALERRAAALAGRWEASAQQPELAEALSPSAEALMRESVALGLAPHHVAHQRLNLLLLEMGVARTSWQAGGAAGETALESALQGPQHELRQLCERWDELLRWFRALGPPLERCWGIFLGEAGFGLLGFLAAEDSPADCRARAGSLGSLLQDWLGRPGTGRGDAVD
uniref:SET domain-containing protein n=1 Tax=Alexandrium monilatum TaxID=311494 RepID=A0A7S4PUZ9_9DINO